MNREGLMLTQLIVSYLIEDDSNPGIDTAGER